MFQARSANLPEPLQQRAPGAMEPHGDVALRDPELAGHRPQWLLIEIHPPDDIGVLRLQRVQHIEYTRADFTK